jgi:hypothetical protein
MRIHRITAPSSAPDHHPEGWVSVCSVCAVCTPCAGMRCHALPCAVMRCHTPPCAAMRCHAPPCAAVRCHALPCAASAYAPLPFSSPCAPHAASPKERRGSDRLPSIPGSLGPPPDLLRRSISFSTATLNVSPFPGGGRVYSLSDASVYELAPIRGSGWLAVFVVGFWLLGIDLLSSHLPLAAEVRTLNPAEVRSRRRLRPQLSPAGLTLFEISNSPLTRLSLAEVRGRRRRCHSCRRLGRGPLRRGCHAWCHAAASAAGGKCHDAAAAAAAAGGDAGGGGWQAGSGTRAQGRAGQAGRAGRAEQGRGGHAGHAGQGTQGTQGRAWQAVVRACARETCYPRARTHTAYTARSTAQHSTHTAHSTTQHARIRRVDTVESCGRYLHASGCACEHKPYTPTMASGRL